MPIGPDFTRAARPDEHDEIDALLVAAFGRRDEADLVRRLRVDGDMWIEAVKPWQGAVAAYAALSRMRAPADWACLAPVAVLPRYQRGAAAPDPAVRHAYAFGTLLARELASQAEVSAHLRARGHAVPTTIVVLGRPEFYQRAGFDLARAQRLETPYRVANTLVARPGTDVPTAMLVYPRAFQVTT